MTGCRRTPRLPRPSTDTLEQHTQGSASHNQPCSVASCNMWCEDLCQLLGTKCPEIAPPNRHQGYGWQAILLACSACERCES